MGRDVRRARHLAEAAARGPEQVNDEHGSREAAEWDELGSGASGLSGALALIDCAVDAIIERHGHGIILGRVLSATLGPGRARASLVHGHGRFQPLLADDGNA